MSTQPGRPVSEETVVLLREFASRRDWGQFHTPKNLSMALAAEAGELLAEFQWLTERQCGLAVESGDLRENVVSELADVAIYLHYLADALSVDLDDAVRAKVARNETRFPVVSDGSE